MKSKGVQQYVCPDVNKESIQVAVINKDGRVLRNARISNKDGEIREMFAKIPKNARCIMESSSVWYGLFRLIADDLKRDVILSNPFNSRRKCTPSPTSSRQHKRIHPKRE